MQRLYNTLTLVAATLFLGGCAGVNFSLIHPEEQPEKIMAWNEEITRGELLIRFQWAAPRQTGPLPTIVIHPGVDTSAEEARNLTWDLAERGYLAVAVDYQRLINSGYRDTIFPLRTRAELTTTLEIIRTHPRVDAQRIALLGFSRGGSYTLRMAAEIPDIKAVVAYYPITDYRTWVKEREQSFVWRTIFRFMRWSFNSESPDHSDEVFLALLDETSPLYHSERITAPVLLVHGKEDGIAPVRDSRAMLNSLVGHGTAVKLVSIDNAGHTFNFKDPHQAGLAWESSLQWFARHLRI